MKNQFSGKIKYIGFVMTCLIVILHCPEVEDVFCLNELDYFVKHYFDVTVSSLESLAMSWFFTVTGFLLFVNFSMEKYPTKIKKRVSNLLVPYLLWQLIFWVIDFAQGQRAISVGDFLRRTFLFVQWPVDGPLWYVYAVFLLALLSPLLYYMVKKKRTGWAVIMAIFLFLKLCDRTDIPAVANVVDFGYIPNFLSYLPAYLTGAFFGLHDKDGKTDCLHYLLPALLMAFLLDGWLTGFFAELCLRFMPISILYLLPPMDLSENKPKLKYIHVHKLSFLVFALHAPLIADLYPYVLEGYIQTIGKLTMSAALGTILMDVFYLAVCIVAASLIHWVLSKKAPRVLALLTGGRA